MARLGNIGASSLIKSAASIATRVNNYNDQIAAFAWENSAKTEADYLKYSRYLDDRSKKLSATNSLTNASKALSLQGSARSAFRTFTSNELSRMSNEIVEGNASPQNKLEAIRTLYYRAGENGDAALQQQLYQQFNAYDQQLQYQADRAAVASEALYVKNQKAIARGYTNWVDQVETILGEMTDTIKAGGQATLTKKLKGYASALKKAGIDIPEGMSPNNGSLIYAAMDAMGKYYVDAADALAIADPDKADEYLNKAKSLAFGYSVGGESATVKVFGKDFNMQEAYQYAANSNKYYSYQDVASGDVKTAESAITGYRFDEKGNIQEINAQFSPISDQTLYGEMGKGERDKVKKELEALGFDFTKGGIDANGNIVGVMSDKAEGQLIRDAMNKFGSDKQLGFRIFKSDDGYTLYDKSTNKLFMLSRDSKGYYGLYEQQHDLASRTGMKFNLLGTSDKRFDRNSDTVSRAFGFAPGSPQALAAKTKQAAVVQQQVKQQMNSVTPSFVKQTPLNTMPTPGKQVNYSSMNPNSLSGYLQGAFANYGTMKQGYTESNIIPYVANTYFGGDKGKAATEVYKYRKPLETSSKITSAGTLGKLF